MRNIKSYLKNSSFLIVGAAFACANFAYAEEAKTETNNKNQEEVVVTATRNSRSSVALNGVEIQKILPGINSLKAIETLPGVLFQTADPWGNNEQNETLFVHGFGLQQLGYTFDNIPLGDQQYGNWNGLSPSRAVISENIKRVIFASGAADLGTASTSNLGGAIDTFSSDPDASYGIKLGQTLGSYKTTRTFLRLDTGTYGNGNSLYISGLYHDAKAWDFNGHQRDKQFNAKYVKEGNKGRLTAFFDYQTKVEPNEDSVVHVAGETSTIYVRPFLYPDYNAALAYLNPVTGAPPASAGSNFSNYHSAAQREDYLGYVKYDYQLNDNMKWSNQIYAHHDYGRGIVAGPINQAGLPALFSVYYPGQDLKTVFGGTGWAVRTTEYLINRSGGISTFKWNKGNHDIEIGAWFEAQYSTQNRSWYPFSANSNDLTPYDIPTNKNFTQYQGHFHNYDLLLHAQDNWHISPKLTLQYGFKSSLQNAKGDFPINQKNLASNTNPTIYPSGNINTRQWFLPQIGALYDLNEHDHLFFNIQKNARQFIVYGAGGISPWSQGSQAAFDYFKQNVKPETSWTYEAGIRTKRQLNLGPITAIEGQANIYHVDFNDRLLTVSSTPVILSLVAGASIISNVGSVKTDGIDIAGTIHFGKNFSIYDAVSYNKSIYQNDYVSGASSTIIPISGKSVPASPNWMNKFIFSARFDKFDAQLSGEYVGKRYATYLNDLWVDSYFITNLQAGYNFDVSNSNLVKDLRLSLNVTNLGDIKTTSTLVVGAINKTYNTYPMPPRMVFVNLTAKF